jgi:hypothetical protein
MDAFQSLSEFYHNEISVTEHSWLVNFMQWISVDISAVPGVNMVICRVKPEILNAVNTFLFSKLLRCYFW